MRKNVAIVFLAMIALFTISSCAPKKTEPIKTNMSNSAGMNTSFCYAIDAGAGTALTITGSSSADLTGTPMIQIVIPGWSGIGGTIELKSDLTNTAYAVYMPSTGTAYFSESGLLTITSITRNEIRGTYFFSYFDGTNMVNVHDGTFVAERR